jgi:hypothetical protein
VASGCALPRPHLPLAPPLPQELDDMARQYIKGDNAIILAVTPANADLATSDALRMARDVDPNGDRTIGAAPSARPRWVAQRGAERLPCRPPDRGSAASGAHPAARAVHFRAWRQPPLPLPPCLAPALGVLTKIDIMDRGTDCRDVLLGKTLKLKHGWVAVVNRGQADINSKVRGRQGRGLTRSRVRPRRARTRTDTDGLRGQLA